MSEKKEITQKDMTQFLENTINEGLYDLQERFLPHLGHSEAKRLLILAMRYPAHEEDVSHEKEDFIKAYSACKRISDALVGMGVEAMIDGMVRKQIEEQQTENKEAPASEGNENG